MDAPSHITQAQAARRLGTSHTNVGRLISLNRLSATVVDGTIMVPAAEVDAEKIIRAMRKAPAPAEG